VFYGLFLLATHWGLTLWGSVVARPNRLADSVQRAAVANQNRQHAARRLWTAETP
jgi:hypothetical protein